MARRLTKHTEYAIEWQLKPRGRWKRGMSRYVDIVAAFKAIEEMDAAYKKTRAAYRTVRFDTVVVAMDPCLVPRKWKRKKKR